MAKSDRVRYVSTFRAPTEYELEVERARRQKALAEALAQQEYQPIEGGVAPIPRAAPLVKALQGYLTARAGRQAEEAVSRAGQLEEEYARRMAGRMEGGYVPDVAGTERIAREGQRTPEQIMAAMPAETTLQEITPTARYVKAPEQALAMASTGLGAAALKDRPVMAARLAKMLEEPKAAEFGTNVQYDDKGRAYVVNKAGEVKYLPDIVETKKPVTRTASDDLGDRIRTYFSDGSFKDTPKGLAPTAPKEEKPQTASEGERKDAYNLGRIVTAANQIQSATKTEPQSVRPGFGEAAIGMLPFGIGEDIKYRAQSPQRQIIDSAQTDLIDAALTLATGAAYTKEQLVGQVRSLIPRYGESDESIAAKNARLRELMSNAKVRAGRAWTPELDAQLAKLFPALQQEEEIIKLPPRRR
jgi:hypothetical protein